MLLTASKVLNELEKTCKKREKAGIQRQEHQAEADVRREERGKLPNRGKCGELRWRSNGRGMQHGSLKKRGQRV